jgi:subtilisin family serine protease
MRRWGRMMARSTLALLVLGATAMPGSAAAAQQPLPNQWWFTSWAVQEDLWPAAKGQGITVAVIDTGVQASLPELGGAVLPGADFQTGSGDGRTDNNPSFGTPGHGTRMAALIASRGNRSGFLGVAPQARILPVVGQSAPAYAKGVRFAAD